MPPTVNGLVAFRRQWSRQFVRQIVAAKRASRATSNMPMARSVPLTMKLPAENSMSCSAASSTWAAMRLPLAISASDALPMTMPASRIERPEWEPPPTGTMSVSPWIRFTQSNGTPSQSVMSCAKLVRWPLSARQRADRHVDTAFGRHRDLGPLARRPGGELDVIGDPMPRRFPRRAAAARRRSGKPSQSASASAECMARS